MAGEVKGALVAGHFETNDPTFKPGTKMVEAVLTPKVGAAAYLPLYSPYGALPPAPPKRSCVLNIETTGLMPFDSRLINIAAMDLREPEKVVTFFDEDESVMLRQFLDWFSAAGLNEIIGYNVSFDFRYLFIKACRYREDAAPFAESDLSDVMQVMQQVKEEFIYGYNKPGTLNEWAEYLLGETAPMSQDAVFKAWEEKRHQDVADYNTWKVNTTAMLYVLSQLVKGEIS